MPKFLWGQIQNRLTPMFSQKIIAVYDDRTDVDVIYLKESREFTNQGHYIVNNRSYGNLYFYDFNNDSYLDLLVSPQDDSYFYVFLGENNHSFSNPVKYLSQFIGRYIIIADINKDLILDIISTNSAGRDISVLFGFGNGSFADPIRSQSVDYRSDEVYNDDFNNDTVIDILLRNYDKDYVTIIFGNKNGSFSNETNYNIGSQARDVLIGDINGDSIPDIVTTHIRNTSINIFLRSENGSIINKFEYSVDNVPFRAQIIDLDNDHRSDLIFVYKSIKIDLFLQFENDSFTNQTIYAVGLVIAYIFPFDVNNDTRLDLIGIDPETNHIIVFLATINGSFITRSKYSVGYNPLSVIAIDINNDFVIDLVVSNWAGNDVSVLFFFGIGDGYFENERRYSFGTRPWSITVVDFNHDSKLDIVVTESETPYISVLFGIDKDVYVKQTIFTTTNDSHVQALIINDFNNDTHQDIALTNSNTHTVSIFLGYGNLSFDKEISYSIESYSSHNSLTSADFNSDNYVDIVIANYDTSTISILLGNKNGSFSNQRVYSTGSNSFPSSIVVNDFNNDTKLDIVVSNSGSNTLGIFLGRNDGTFENMIIFPLEYGSQPFSVIVAGFNDDHKLDFAVGNAASDSSDILLQTC
ncbi:unnamed protein product [Adineta ricciae]|nr:unnamed protein product [Adineta ricciae]